MTARHGIAFGMALFLTACASSGMVTEANWPRDRDVIDGYDIAATNRVLAHGLKQIQMKALHNPSMESFVLTGLRGLSDIDPTFTVLEVNGRIQTYVDDTLTSDLAKPADDGVESWLAVFQGSVVGARWKSDFIAKADNEEIYSSFFSTALENLDPYSRYAGRLQARSNREIRNGFGGLGLTYTASELGLEVRGVQPGSPAIAAGLRSGDLITHVDGQTVATKRSWTIRRLLRGTIGSKSVLTVLRGHLDGAMRIEIVRSLIVPQSVEASLDDGIAVIRVHNFNQQTSKTVQSELARLRQLAPGLSAVVMDLRGDPGGLLDQAVAVSDLFMETGSIVATLGRHPESIQRYQAFEGDIAAGLPLAILVDSRSASAAEIVAAALQDSGRGIVIGTSTYGKGTVQTVIRLPNDGEITLTWSRFHAPDGYAIEDLGVLPMVCTSGLDKPAPEVMTAWQQTGSQFAARRARWRTVAAADIKARSTLREHCPAQVRGDDSIDLNVAKELVLNDKLYARAVGLTATTAAQTSQ